MNKVVRCEYEAWEIETLLDTYNFTREDFLIKKAIVKFENLKKYTNKEGGLMMSNLDKRVWIGENGLAAWGSLRLYELTKKDKFYNQAKIWLNYIIKNPVIKRKDQPRLYLVFLAWNNYALIKMAETSGEKYWKNLAIKYSKELIKAQKTLGNWSICFHYDYYVAQSLLFTYSHFKKNNKYLTLSLDCFKATRKFIDNTRHTKTIFTKLRPIHYFVPIASGYTSLQHSHTCFSMFLETFNVDDFLEGEISFLNVKRYLLKDGKVLKQKGDKKGNDLATIWLKRAESYRNRCKDILVKENLI